MTTHDKKPKYLWITKLFGTFGYISCLMQWGWWTLLFVPSIMGNQFVRSLLLPEPNSQPETITRGDGAFSFLYVIVAVISVVLVLAAIAYILAIVPGQIAKAGNTIVRTTTAATLPIVTHKKKLAPKKRLALSLRISKLVKLGLVVIPFGLLSVLLFVPLALSSEIVWIVGAFLAIGSMLWFSLEYLSAKLLAVDEQLLI